MFFVSFLCQSCDTSSCSSAFTYNTAHEYIDSANYDVLTINGSPLILIKEFVTDCYALYSSPDSTNDMSPLTLFKTCILNSVVGLPAWCCSGSTSPSPTPPAPPIPPVIPTVSADSNVINPALKLLIAFAATIAIFAIISVIIRCIALCDSKYREIFMSYSIFMRVINMLIYPLIEWAPIVTPQAKINNIEITRIYELSIILFISTVLSTILSFSLYVNYVDTATNMIILFVTPLVVYILAIILIYVVLHLTGKLNKNECSYSILLYRYLTSTPIFADKIILVNQILNTGDKYKETTQENIKEQPTLVELNTQFSTNNKIEMLPKTNNNPSNDTNIQNNNSDNK